MLFCKRKLLIISILLLLILCGHHLIWPGLALASSLDESSLYKGIAVAVLVYIVARLGKSLFSSSSPADTHQTRIYPEKDIDWLAHVIHGEARGEPFEGQIAVGAVVMNRVRDKNFPNTIEEVIMAHNQFSCIPDGQFFLTPNETSYRAARRALAGEDPTGGALYFYNPRTARNMSFFQGLRTLLTIGNHVFATHY